MSVANLDTNNLANIGSGYLKSDNLSSILDSAKQFQTIIQSEINQYDTQNKLVTTAALAKQRQVTLTDSTRKRTEAYSYMMFIVCVFLGIMLLLSFLKPMIEFVPGIIFDLVIALLGGGVVIFVIVNVRAIQARDVSDYDRLNLPAPSPSTMVSAASSGSNDLISASYVPPCVGAACCGSGMRYNPETAVCEPGDAMNTMETAGWSNAVSINKNTANGAIQPYNFDGSKTVF